MIVDRAGSPAHLQFVMENLATFTDVQAFEQRISTVTRHSGAMRPHRTTVAGELTRLFNTGDQP